MKCVVINGTEQKGCTYMLKEIFLDELKPEQLSEFYLPKDAPDYCTGCKLCFMKGESLCPHHKKVAPIWQAMLEADLIVFAYPVYVLRTPGHVKAYWIIWEFTGAHIDRIPKCSTKPRRLSLKALAHLIMTRKKMSKQA